MNLLFCTLKSSVFLLRSFVYRWLYGLDISIFTVSIKRWNHRWQYLYWPNDSGLLLTTRLCLDEFEYILEIFEHFFVMRRGGGTLGRFTCAVHYQRIILVILLDNFDFLKNFDVIFCEFSGSPTIYTDLKMIRLSRTSCRFSMMKMSLFQNVLGYLRSIKVCTMLLSLFWFFQKFIIVSLSDCFWDWIINRFWMDSILMLFWMIINEERNYFLLL